MGSLPVVAAVALVALALSGCVSQDAPPRESGRIDGAVVDGLLSPWSNTTVRLVELGRVDTTNELGGFSFLRVPPGTYTLRVAIEDTEGDHEVVVVEDQDVARTILQVDRPLQDLPHLTRLRHSGTSGVGLPGSPCSGCSWQASLPEGVPDHLRLTVRWDDGQAQLGHAAPPMLDVELRDGVGRLVGKSQGASPLELTLHGHSFRPDTTSVEVRVKFHSGNDAPHTGVHVEKELELFYGLDP